ncbi:MAG: hypothetical protein OQK82_09290 [Candidatus Pacearchaeota archaeon]|nr:hypothetical protein [Candidatus Pacearchaeota archaeon]
MKMRTKNLMVFFLAIVSMFALVATVSAYNYDANSFTDNLEVKVDGILVGASSSSSQVSVIAGETISVRVYFDALKDASDVRIKAEIEGDKVDVDDRTESFDVENGSRYSKTLTLTVPSELKDDLSDNLELTLKIWNGDEKSEVSDIFLNVQRETYNANIKSVSVDSSVDAGEKLPVNVVLKNTGYNDLDDLYVTVTIAGLDNGLDVTKTSYFGDLVAIESDDDDDDDEDTASGRLYLSIPYDAVAGSYTLEVEVTNDDTVSKQTKQITVNNDFSAGEVIRNGESLLIVNPTNKLKVYRVIFPESESYVSVSAGTSKTVPVPTSGDVSVLTMDGAVVDAFTFGSASTEDEASSMSDPIVVLTVILAIVFVVLLVVLIVLIGKKPEKSEDFGESYY